MEGPPRSSVRNAVVAVSVSAMSILLLASASVRGDIGRCAHGCRAAAAACIKVHCADIRGQTARACRQTCRGAAGCTRIGTLAYVTTECGSDANGTTGSQALMVRRGHCIPRTVMELAAGPPAPDPLDLCGIWGASRTGVASKLAGGFHRLAVSPDGEGVVFELSQDQALFPLVNVPPDLSGIYYIRADGSRLRRLAAASRLRTYYTFPDPRSLLGGLGVSFNAYPIAFSPDGRRVAYTDIGPGPEEEEAPQVVVLEIESGVRTQLTRLPPPPVDRETGVGFIDNSTVFFSTWANPDGLNPNGELRRFTVGVDGSGLKAVPPPVALQGATLDSIFQIVGDRGLHAVTYILPGTPVVPGPPDIREAFALFGGRRLVQLTNFRRGDTLATVASRQNGRIIFTASADPLGTNPSENCQIFSVDPLGRRKRQLTQFREAEHSMIGCTGYPEAGCNISAVHEDLATGRLVFVTSCDPFQVGFFGQQIFALRPNGTGLRQLTSTRGLVAKDDGGVAVEMPGPWAISERL